METRVHSSMASPGPHVLGMWYCTWLTGSFRLSQKAASTCKCKSSTVKAQSLFVEECKTTECKHGRSRADVPWNPTMLASYLFDLTVNLGTLVLHCQEGLLVRNQDGGVWFC